MGFDVTQVRSLLEQAQPSARGQAKPTPAQEFADLRAQTSQDQEAAQQAFARHAADGTGQLHDVMAQIAKADLSFRYLLEIRNKLTEAYQEISRLPV